MEHVKAGLFCNKSNSRQEDGKLELNNDRIHRLGDDGRL